MTRAVRTMALAGAVAGVLGCSSLEITAPPFQVIEEIEFHPSLEIDLDAMERRPSGIYIQDLEIGEGDLAEVGATVDVAFGGWIATSGRQFAGERAGILLGFGEIPPGLDEAIQGMRVGGRRKAVVPPELGYGASLNAPVPSGSVLVYEIEVFEVFTPGN